MKKPKLIEVEKLHPINSADSGAFLIIFRQAVCRALEQERKNRDKPVIREEKT